MKSTFRATVAAITVLATGVLSGCGSDDSADAEQDSPLSNAAAELVYSALPTQQQIADKSSFPYLMANPTVAQVSVAQSRTESQRASEPLQREASGDASTARKVSESCAAYDQAASGLMTVPDASWVVTGGARRNILIGQNGIDQITGYTNVLTTGSAETAANLLDDFKSDTADCAEALKDYYPDIADRFSLNSPTVDAATGTVTLRGVYNGKSFAIAINQEDRYLFTTWFIAIDDGGDNTISDAATTIQNIALENVDNL